MPTSREHRAQRLMHKSQLDDLQMPRFVPKVIIPPQKENDLYPLKWPAYKSVRITFNLTAGLVEQEKTTQEQEYIYVRE